MVIQKIDVKGFAKFFGVFSILIGVIVCIPAGIYFLLFQGEIVAGIMIMIFGPAVLGLDGLITGALFALFFNLTGRIAGGIRIETAP